MFHKLCVFLLPWASLVSIPNTVFAQSFADYEIKDASVDVKGSMATFSATMCAVAGANSAIYYNLDPQFSGPAYGCPGPITEVGPFASCRKYSHSKTLPPGTYTARFWTCDTNLSNNVQSVTYTISAAPKPPDEPLPIEPPKVNFTMGALRAQVLEALESGEFKVSFDMQVCNAGTQAKGTHVALFYDRYDPSCSALPDQKFDIVNIPVGECVHQTAEATLEEGHYVAKAVVDQACATAETSEDDNYASTQLTLGNESESNALGGSSSDMPPVASGTSGCAVRAIRASRTHSVVWALAIAAVVQRRRRRRK